MTRFNNTKSLTYKELEYLLQTQKFFRVLNDKNNKTYFCEVEVIDNNICCFNTVSNRLIYRFPKEELGIKYKIIPDSHYLNFKKIQSIGAKELTEFLLGAKRKGIIHIPVTIYFECKPKIYNKCAFLDVTYSSLTDITEGDIELGYLSPDMTTRHNLKLGDLGTAFKLQIPKDFVFFSTLASRNSLRTVNTFSSEESRNILKVMYDLKFGLRGYVLSNIHSVKLPYSSSNYPVKFLYLV
jgi:hypothetical protein